MGLVNTLSSFRRDIVEEVYQLYQSITYSDAIKTYNTIKHKSYLNETPLAIKRDIATLYTLRDNLPERRIRQVDSLLTDLEGRLKRMNDYLSSSKL